MKWIVEERDLVLWACALGRVLELRLFWKWNNALHLCKFNSMQFNWGLLGTCSYVTLHYITRSVRVVVNCIVRVSQSKIPLNIYGGGERWCNVTTVPCSTFCILPYVLWTSSQRIRFPLEQRYPLEIDLYASCYHAIGTRNVNMFSQVSNIQTISNLSRAYTRSAQNICDSSPAQSRDVTSKNPFKDWRWERKVEGTQRMAKDTLANKKDGTDRCHAFIF